MLPSKDRTSFPPGTLGKLLVLLSTFILAISVIALNGRASVFAQDGSKAIGTVQIESTQPGELVLSWNVPASTPRDYRVSWARVGENFKTWTDESGNAFPTTELGPKNWTTS